MSTNVGMAGWGLSTVEEKPLVHVIVIAVIALVAYFSWWKRRCDTVSGSNSIQLDERRQFPEGTPHYHRYRKDRYHRYLSDPGLLPGDRWWWHLRQYHSLSRYGNHQHPEMLLFDDPATGERRNRTGQNDGTD